MADKLQSHIDELRRRTEADGLSRAEADASWAAIEARVVQPRRVWLPVAALAVGLTVLLAGILLYKRSHESWYRIAEGASCVRGGTAITVAEGCGDPVIEVGRDRIQVAAGVTLTSEPDGLRMKRGRARFTVAHRRAGERPFEVAVSHGKVRVLGTVFTVQQVEGGGEVNLESGSIEFRWNDGSPPTLLAPGQTLAWPPRAPEPPPVAPQEKTPPPERRDPPRTETDPQTADDIMQKQFQLRGQRRYQDAAELLERASRRNDFSKAQRERFSFELGNVLQLAGREQDACGHWRRHVARFPGSARKTDVKRQLEACKQ